MAKALGNGDPPPSAADAVVRGELVEAGDGRRALVGIRRMRWGTQVCSERPLLLIEADVSSYLRAEGADPRLLELAAALGDPVRLAAYVAFKQLHERRQKDILSLWREGITANDPVAARAYEQTQRGVDRFVEDHPQFARLVYWTHFVMISAIFGRFGIQNPDGSRGLYALSSYLRHSCTPNVAAFALKKGYPKGRRLLHIIATEGVAKGEELTVSHVPESFLLLPTLQRAPKVTSRIGYECNCARCQESGDGEDAREVLRSLELAIAVQPPTDESTTEAHCQLRRMDKLLPFSMQVKAKAKVLLACSFSELTSRAAWQDEVEGANIIQWTGLSMESRDTRLKDTKKLFETGAKDFELLLGQGALPLLDRIEEKHAPTRDQHKILSKYSREQSRAAAQGAATAPMPQAAAGGRAAQAGETSGKSNVLNPEALPPGWAELFKTNPLAPGGADGGPASGQAYLADPFAVGAASRPTPNMLG